MSTSEIVKILVEDLEMSSVVVARILFYLYDKKFEKLLNNDTYEYILLMDSFDRWKIDLPTIDNIISFQNVSILNKVEEHIKGYDIFLASMCLNNGYLESLKWIDEKFNTNFKKLDRQNDAAKNGHLHILKWLKQKHNIICSDIGLNYCLIYGHLHILKWIKKESPQLIRPVLMYDIARRYKQIHVIEWLKYDCLFKNVWIYEYLDEHEADLCSKHGDLEGLKTLKEQFNIEMSERGKAYAKEYNHKHILRWLK